MGKRAEEQGALREFSAGGVVFKDGEWLIIRPAGTKRWQFPKGKIDENESSKEAALREVEEEGGVKVEIVEKIGNSHYFFVLKGKKIFKTVAFYLMKYLGDTKKGHDWEVEKAVFVPYTEALEKLSFKDDREILKKAKKLLDQGKVQTHPADKEIWYNLIGFKYLEESHKQSLCEIIDIFGGVA